MSHTNDFNSPGTEPFSLNPSRFSPVQSDLPIGSDRAEPNQKQCPSTNNPVTESSRLEPSGSSPVQADFCAELGRTELDHRLCPCTNNPVTTEPDVRLTSSLEPSQSESGLVRADLPAGPDWTESDLRLGLSTNNPVTTAPGFRLVSSLELSEIESSPVQSDLRAGSDRIVPGLRPGPSANNPVTTPSSLEPSDSSPISAPQQARSDGCSTQKCQILHYPLCIFPPMIFVSSQPTPEVACRFDLVINLAADLEIPFTEGEEWNIVKMQMPLNNLNSSSLTQPNEMQTHVNRIQGRHNIVVTGAVRDKSVVNDSKTNVENEWNEDGLDYIHIQWEKELDMVKGISDICSVVNSYAIYGKSVLIHDDTFDERSYAFLVAYSLLFHHMSYEAALAKLEAQNLTNHMGNKMVENLKLLESSQTHSSSEYTFASAQSIAQPGLISSQRLRRRKGYTNGTSLLIQSTNDPVTAVAMSPQPESAVHGFRVGLARQKSCNTAYLSVIYFKDADISYRELCEALATEYKRQRGFARIIFLRTLHHFEVVKVRRAMLGDGSYGILMGK